MARIYLINSRGSPHSLDFVITNYSYPLLQGNGQLAVGCLNCLKPLNALHYTALHRSTLNYTALDRSTLKYTALN